jgi:transketolase
MQTMRERFVTVTSDLLDEDPTAALVLADISAAAFVDAAKRYADRVLNVGIREQLAISVAGGLALTGIRPVVHSYAPFLVERVFEQVKLDLAHQNLGAVLVSVGGSYDWAAGGRTHHSPGDVALLDTLPGWTIHVPGHPDEAEVVIRDAVRRDDRVYIRLSERSNPLAVSAGAPGLHVVRRGAGATVIAVGPMLDNVLAATEGLDVTMLYASTVRPFDAEGLRASVVRPDVVLVEPYLAGTSSRVVGEALVDRPHRLLALGVGREEVRRYGKAADHDRLHGLDPAGLRAAITSFVTASWPLH